MSMLVVSGIFAILLISQTVLWAYKKGLEHGGEDALKVFKAMVNKGEGE